MIWLILGEVIYSILIFFVLVFLIYSLYEKENRAFLRSGLVLLILTGIYSVIFAFFPEVKSWFFVGIFVLSMVVILWIAVSSKPQGTIKITGEQKKVDERDTIFARFDLENKSERYKKYYSAHKEYIRIDEDIRKLNDILDSYFIKKNPVLFSLADAEFNFCEQQLLGVDGNEPSIRFERSPEENTRMVKNTIDYLGSDLCGICKLDQAYVYSHVGRGPETYGSKIECRHKYAIVFGIEMRADMINCAPQAPVIVESAKQYVEVAKISIICASLIRRLGYPARAHISESNYQVIATPLAWKAGLGEIGRMGILITKKYGPRIRLGVITTDLPLIPDEPAVFGVQDFCKKCRKCAENCPSKAIPSGEKLEENGVLKWVIKREECYRYWRKVGTDCARCIMVCPYSKPNNLLHNIIRNIIRGSSAAQTISVKGDDFFYGRYPKKKQPLHPGLNQ
jgi:ferredoxin